MKVKTFFLLIFGLGFLGLGGFLTRDAAQVLLNGIKTTGRVIDIQKSISEDSEGDTSYTYMHQLEYQCGSNKTIESWQKFSSSTRYTIEETLNIKCDPSNPKNFMIMDIPNFMVFFFPAMGLITTIFGIRDGIKYIKLSRKKKFLQENGTKILANIVGIQESGLIMDNQRYYYITAEHNGKIFTSEEETKQAISNGQITIYLNPTNPNEYWMDLESMRRVPTNTIP